MVIGMPFLIGVPCQEGPLMHKAHQFNRKASTVSFVRAYFGRFYRTTAQPGESLKERSAVYVGILHRAEHLP